MSAILPYLLSYRSRIAAGPGAGGSSSSSLANSADAEAPASGLALASPLTTGAGGLSSSLGLEGAQAGQGQQQPQLWAEGAAPSSGADGCSPLATLLDTSLLRALLALPDSGALLR